MFSDKKNLCMDEILSGFEKQKREDRDYGLPLILPEGLG